MSAVHMSPLLNNVVYTRKGLTSNSSKFSNKHKTKSHTGACLQRRHLRVSITSLPPRLGEIFICKGVEYFSLYVAELTVLLLKLLRG